MPPPDAAPPGKPAPPAVPPTLPPVIVMAEMLTVLAGLISKTRVTLLPLMVRLPAPGPVIVMFLAINSSVTRVIEVTAGSNVIVPPSQTPVSIASRNVFGPLSALLVTTTDAVHRSEEHTSELQSLAYL